MSGESGDEDGEGDEFATGPARMPRTAKARSPRAAG